ncbi:MAG: hypothetical protein LC745_12500 [Planctomycetia bacterium]|nr:hypothetical protein [Planctomycetia bacterium]
MSTTSAASPKLSTAPATQASPFAPGVSACRGSPGASSQGDTPFPQDRQW